MKSTDAEQFRVMLTGVYAFYRQEFSDFAVGVWWEAMKPFDFAAVKDALNRHCVNPDNGQFLPKPADVVKLLGGSNLDRATLAWTKTLKAVQHVGTYESVCFDDPIINAVIHEMGGWIAMGAITEKESPFKQREFEQRYRAYRTRGGMFAYPRSLPGIIARENGARGFGEPEPVLIGEKDKAALVFKRGGDGIKLDFTPLSAAMPMLKETEAA